MSKRVILTSSILLAFLAGAWGNVLAASFCPRIGLAHACCLKHYSHPSQSRENHAIHHMDMGQMPDMPMEMPAEPTQETSPQQQPEPLAQMDRIATTAAWDPIFETCSHCLNHSQLPFSTATLRETESTKRSTDAGAPRLVPGAPLATLPGLIFDPRDHAPPGALSPRHLLINVFRI
jgi:hypothetical protein